MEMENQQQQLQLFCFYCQKNSNFSYNGQTNFLLTFGLKTKYITSILQTPVLREVVFFPKVESVPADKSSIFDAVSAQCLILSFEFCLWLFQVRLFDTSQTLKSCPDVRQIIFVAKQHKYFQQPKLHGNVWIVCCYSLLKCNHLLMQACEPLGKFWYWQFHQISFVSLFIPQLPTLQYFYVPSFILFPEFSITSRRSYCYEIQWC